MGDADLQSGNCRFCELGVPSVGMTTDIEILRVLAGRDHLLRRREIAGFGISAAVFQRWEDEGRWLQVTPKRSAPRCRGIWVWPTTVC